jgi:hypothetical protein
MLCTAVLQRRVVSCFWILHSEIRDANGPNLLYAGTETNDSVPTRRIKPEPMRTDLVQFGTPLCGSVPRPFPQLLGPQISDPNCVLLFTVWYNASHIVTSSRMCGLISSRVQSSLRLYASRGHGGGGALADGYRIRGLPQLVLYNPQSHF